MDKLSHQLAATTSKVVKERRLSLTLSQDALSKRTGLARSYISDVERGSRHPTLHNLTLIADALDWNPSELIKEIEIQVTLLLDPDKLQLESPELTDLEREIIHYANTRISQGIVIADALGRFVLYNDTATQLLGVGRTDATPDEWSDLYGCFWMDRVTPMPTPELPLVKALSGRPTDTNQLFLRNKNLPAGSCIEVNSRQILDPLSGALKGGVAIVTRLKC